MKSDDYSLQRVITFIMAKIQGFFIAHKSHPFLPTTALTRQVFVEIILTCRRQLFSDKILTFSIFLDGFVFSRLLCFPKVENSTVIHQSTKIKTRLLGSCLNGKINNKT